MTSSFDALWNRWRGFTFPAQPPDLCPSAQQFAVWAEGLCNTVEQERDIVSVNQSKVLLLDRYFAYRSSVPNAHKNRIGAVGHFCIFHVFELAYNRLRIVELSITPPLLFLPPPPPPPPQILGIGLGTLDQE
jgi:hypothetical protein